MKDWEIEFCYMYDNSSLNTENMANIYDSLKIYIRKLLKIQRAEIATKLEDLIDYKYGIITIEDAEKLIKKLRKRG